MVSIITITYNRCELLEMAIVSVLNQSIKNWEYFIVDDGSTDGTETMVNNFNEPRIHYIKMPHTGHLSALRNQGLARAKGGIVALLDSDDFWEREYLEKLLVLYAIPDSRSVICNALVWGHGEEDVLFSMSLIAAAQNNVLRQRLLRDDLVIYPSCFSFRQTQPALAFNESMKHGDADLFLRILAMGDTRLMSEPMVNIVKHGGNLSTNSHNGTPAFVHDYAEALQSIKGLLKSRSISRWLYHRTKAKYLYKLGNSYRQIGQKRPALNNYWLAFVTQPYNLKILAKLLATVFR